MSRTNDDSAMPELERSPDTPRPTVDADDIVTPPPSTAEGSVGSEGGSSLIGSPRRTNRDADRPDDDVTSTERSQP